MVSENAGVSEQAGNNGRVRDAVRTRTALLDAALEVFLRDGYAEAATEEIVAVAGVTRGALYHHFENKRDLFSGVIERLQQEAGATRVPDESIDDPWTAFTDAVLASLDVVDDPAIRRLVLIEAPAVLGWTVVRELHRDWSVRSIEQTLALLDGSGSGHSVRASVRAYLLIAAIEEAMLYLAHSENPQRDRRVVQEELQRVLAAARPEKTA